MVLCWWHWLTSKRMARVRQHQLSFLLLGAGKNLNSWIRKLYKLKRCRTLRNLESTKCEDGLAVRSSSIVHLCPSFTSPSYHADLHIPQVIMSCSQCWMLLDRHLISETRTPASTIVHCRSCFTKIYTGCVCLSECSKACYDRSHRSQHQRTSLIIASRSPTLPVAVICDLPLSVDWLYHVFVAAHLIPVPSPLPGPTVWNSLPECLPDPAVGHDQFRRDLETFLFTQL